MSSDRGRRAMQLIARLGMKPHPEGGFFAETYRAPTPVTAPTHAAPRSAGTAIYFLITAEAPRTYLHRLLSDELFHLYEGGPLDIVRLFPDGSGDVARLGLTLEAGERPAGADTGGNLVWDRAGGGRLSLLGGLHGGARF